MLADLPVAVTTSVDTKSGLPNPGSKVIFLTEPSCSSVIAWYPLIVPVAPDIDPDIISPNANVPNDSGSV